MRAALGARGLLVSDRSGQEAAGAATQSQNGWTGLIALLVILGYIAIAVVNTLVMATGERSRELALLQLIGSSRGQVRSMMRIEAVLVAVIAMVFGVVVALPPLIGMSMASRGSRCPCCPGSDHWRSSQGWARWPSWRCGSGPRRPCARVR